MVDFAHNELERASSHQVRATVPAYIAKRVKLIRESGDGDTDDGAIEGAEEDGEVDANHDGEDFEEGEFRGVGRGAGEGRFDGILAVGGGFGVAAHWVGCWVDGLWFFDFFDGIGGGKGGG